MQELVGADSASLVTALIGDDATQQSKIVCLRQQSWYTAAAENIGPEASRVRVLGGHTRVSKSVDDGEVEACRSLQTIGGGGDTTIPPPGRSTKQPLLGIGLHDPLHDRLILPGGWSSMSPVEAIFVPSPPKTGTNL